MPFWLDTAKRLEALAQAGLAYCTNDYDRDRYEEIKRISYAMFHEYTGTPVEKIPELFSSETAYPTPKVDIRGVVLRDNKILMVREKLDGLWALPGGWADIGYSPREVAVKEVQEEAGLNVEPVRLLAVLDKKLHNHPPSPFYIYKLFILCRETGGELKAGSETLDCGFFDLQELPPLSTGRNTEKQILTMARLSEDHSAEVMLD